MRYPDLYQAAVSWSAPLDLLAQIKHYKKEDAYFAYEFWKTAVGDPKTEKSMPRKISPTFNIDKLKSPLLIFHGELDATIPVEQVENFERALGAQETRLK
jgi:dipeptidyl aminopeptidase/acylaminoacyl peptidase